MPKQADTAPLFCARGREISSCFVQKSGKCPVVFVQKCPPTEFPPLRRPEIRREGPNVPSFEKNKITYS